ncbi:uncharacterized protein [Euwallacea similis]|uniref:uncharacterized protein isoform X1 n=1 Tax=Euwallacea similis TaxID=1736056 RepID=UPI00344CA0A4
MSSSLTLNEQSIVCRTCLKVLETRGSASFAFIDDENGYVNNVGNVREMLQFCIPELDLYVSSQPVICYQCLKILVQVYNFKIKCLNVENTIKSYIARNNLQEYNHVNLNCVLMDDLKMKSQSIQIENRIKDMMLKELPENSEKIDSKPIKSPEPEKEVLGYNLLLTKPAVDIVTEDTQQWENDSKMDIQLDESDIDLKFESLRETESCDSSEDDSSINGDDLEGEISLEGEKPGSIVAVRKDLFEPSPPEINQHSLLLNSQILNTNGKIIIKIDRKNLEPLTVVPTLSQPLADTANASIVHENSGSNILSTSEGVENSPQIVAVESVADTEAETNNSYTCNKCNFVTDDVIKMYDHNRSTHNFDYTCQYCPFSTSKVELLGKHMTMVHPQNMIQKKTANFKVTENYACTLCPFSVKTIDLLRSHHLSAHRIPDGATPIVLNAAFGNMVNRVQPKILKRLEYTCDICPYSTKDKSNLRKHLFTHGTKPLKCDHCSYKCVSPYQLRRHQKQKHAKLCDPRSRNQPYKLPDFKKENDEAMDTFKVTLDNIKRELDKEINA